jgi:hypothetical protein
MDPTKNNFMKQLKHLCLLATLAVLTFSCQKELSNESGNPGNLNSQWEFTETAGFKGSIDTAYLEPSGGFQSLVFEGPSSDGKGAIYLQIFGSSITATTFKNPNVNFIYIENGTPLYSNVPTNADKFTVVITTIDATSVTGTFDGEVENAAGEIKSITNGKFTAVLKQVVQPPLQNLCKLRNIGFIDPTTGLGSESLTSFYNSANKVGSIRYIDSSSGQSLLDYTFTYTATRVNIDAEQYFELDADGRVKTFSGYLDGVRDTSNIKVLIRYSYNTNGNMTRAEYSLAGAPTATLYQVDFTWTGGNLTRTVQASVASQQKVQFDYVYDATKSVSDFIAFFPNYEVFYTQTAINYGKNSVNVPTKSTLTIYDDTGVKTDEEVSTFTDYAIDSKNHVTSFKINGDGSFLPGNTRYALSYHCY